MLDFNFSLNWAYGEKRGSFTLVHREFREGLRDWSPAFVDVAEDVLDPYVSEGFKSEGESEGATWAELAPSTVKKRGSAHPILHVTGHLEESFRKGGAEHVEDITPKQLTWGSEVPYALFHEFGTRGRINFKAAGARKVIAKTTKAAKQLAESQGQTGGLVPRPMLVWSTFLANEITSKMRSYGELIARKVGFGLAAAWQEAVSPVEARKIGAIALSGQQYPGRG